MTKEELIVKIKKLQAMSESSNPNEAAMALSRIQKLMETYSLEAFLKKPSVCSQFFIKRVPHP